MIDEQLEFRLTQYLDGTLPFDQAPALFDELAKNPQALDVLDEYRKLDLLMSAKPAAVRWDELAEHISAHIDEDQQSRMRIGIFARPLRIAVAAAVLLAVGVGTWLSVGRQGPADPNTPIVVAPKGVIEVTGPQVEVAAGTTVIEIEIGPALADADPASYYYEELANRPQRVIIAGGLEDRVDERPY
jgi:hypothetical protein